MGLTLTSLVILGLNKIIDEEENRKYRLTTANGFLLFAMTNITQNKAKFKSRERRDISASCYTDSSPKRRCWAVVLTALGQPMAINQRMIKTLLKSTKRAGEVRYKKTHVHVIYVANNNNVTTDSVPKLQQALWGASSQHGLKICDNIGNYYKYLTRIDDTIAKENRNTIRRISNC